MISAFPVIASGYIPALIGLGEKHVAVRGCTVTQGALATATQSIQIDPAFAGIPAERLLVLPTAGIGSAATAGMASFRVSTLSGGVLVIDVLRSDTLAVWVGAWNFVILMLPQDK